MLREGGGARRYGREKEEGAMHRERLTVSDTD